jgi:RNA polymerase sigma-70 factor, ECF subfamily
MDMRRLDDSTLWERSRAGDREAFGVLFGRHAKLIYNFCFRRVADWTVAEDLVSVVFLEAWRRRQQPLPAGKVVPWLFGIATNVVRNRRRSQRRYAAALNRIPRPQPDPDFSSAVDERLDDEARMREVLVQLGRLPRRELEVLALCAWSELSYQDAALALGVPVGTVRSRLSRARSRLRELGIEGGHEQNTTASSQEVV